MLFLDFEKAYDRLDRGWLFQSMASLGFPASAMRWVQLLLQGTAGRIMYNRGSSVAAGLYAILRL